MLLPQLLAPTPGPGGVIAHAPQRRQRCRPPSRRPVNPRSNPTNHPRDCHNRAAGRDPGVMGIPYRGLRLITLVGTTHNTSLLYVATRGRRAKSPSPILVHGGSTAHHQAGTTCHTALAAIRRLPSPHTQAMRTLLPMSRLRRCVRHRDVSKRTHISHSLLSCIFSGPQCVLTTPSVMPQPKNPPVTIQSCPP